MEGQAKSWNRRGWLLLGDRQLGAAEEAASHGLELSLDQRREFWVCDSHHLLGEIHRVKGERGKAIRHFEAAIGIASPFGWDDGLFWVHHSLAVLFCNENELDNAQSHIERAKSHVVDDAYKLGRVMHEQAEIWYRQGRLEEAKAEILCATELFEKLGAMVELQAFRSRLWKIERALEHR